MANCPSDDQLYALLDQTLAADVLTNVEAHLASCDHCQERLDNFTSAADLLVGPADVSAIPDDVVAQLRETPNAHVSSTTDVGPREDDSVQSPPSIPGFKVDEHIASGASGALYRATDEKLRRIVAIKVMHAGLARSESARLRLQREARAVAAVDHPNVVSVHSTGEDAHARPFMVMELIDGMSIAEHIADAGPFLPRTAAELVEQAARGLAAAHDSGLIHRDVKSSNVLIDSKSQTAKVVDFGLVREDEQETRLTMDGMLAGTPAYMSPEQIIDPTTVDARTDLYSLGIVLYEMLTGIVPFRGVVRMTLQQVQHSEPQAPRELDDAIPRDLQTICLKAIEKDPERRYVSAAALANDLQRWLNNKPIVARPVSQIEKGWRWCQRNRRISVMSALVAFALASAIGVTAASAYRLALANQEVRDADQAARTNADALVVQRDAAMETVRKLVFDVPSLLQEIPADTSDVEKTILRIALEGLDRVGLSAESSGEVDFNTAHALQQLGYALYVADELDDAEVQLDRSLTLIQQMKDHGEPFDITASLEQQVHFLLADIDLVLGNADEERQHREAAIKVSRQWLKQSPDDVAAHMALASSLRMMAELQTEDGNSELATKQFQESRQILEGVVERWPDDELAAMELDETIMSSEAFAEEPQDPEVDRQKRILQSELKAVEQNYAENPENNAARSSVTTAMLKLARWHTVFGNPDRAEKLYASAKGLLESAENPDIAVLLKVDRLSADALLSGGYAKQARNIYRKTLAKHEALPISNEHGSRHSEFIQCRIGLAEAYIEQANGKKAKPLLEEVIESFGDIQSLTSDQQQQLVTAKSALAWTAYYQDDDEKAATLLSAAQQSLVETKEGLLNATSKADIYVNEWIVRTTEDHEFLRASIDEATAE